MIELSRYIELLLQKNECVIVPGFGAFVKRQMSARFIESEQLFFPPYTSVGFNPLLVNNDGILVHAYMYYKKLSYVEAQKEIEISVLRLRKVLAEKGEVDFGYMGTLKKGIEGSIDFLPAEAGLLSTEQYGLGVLSIKPLEVVEPLSQKSSKVKKRAKHSDDRYTIHIKRQWVYNTITVAASLLLFFLFSTPIGNQPIQQHATFNNFIFESIAQYNSAKSIAENPSRITDIDPITADCARTVIETTPTVANVSTTEKSSTTYTLVLASAVSERNANALIEKLYDKGFNEAHLYRGKTITRVHYASYPTEELAQHALRELRDVTEFKDAWIHAIK